MAAGQMVFLKENPFSWQLLNKVSAAQGSLRKRRLVRQFCFVLKSILWDARASSGSLLVRSFFGFIFRKAARGFSPSPWKMLYKNLKNLKIRIFGQYQALSNLLFSKAQLLFQPALSLYIPKAKWNSFF